MFDHHSAFPPPPLRVGAEGSDSSAAALKQPHCLQLTHNTPPHVCQATGTLGGELSATLTEVNSLSGSLLGGK